MGRERLKTSWDTLVAGIFGAQLLISRGPLAARAGKGRSSFFFFDESPSPAPPPVLFPESRPT